MHMWTHLFEEGARGVNVRLGLAGTAPGDGSFEGLKPLVVPPSTAKALVLPHTNITVRSIDAPSGLSGCSCMMQRPMKTSSCSSPAKYLLVLGRSAVKVSHQAWHARAFSWLEVEDIQIFRFISLVFSRQ